MKTFLLIFAFLLAAAPVFGQTPSATPDTNFQRPYYAQKVTLHKNLPKKKNAIVFVGDSITDGNEWAEQLDCPRCENRGISADISYGVLARLDDMLASRPAKIFLMIGVNDISRNIPNEAIINNYREFVSRTRAASPKTKIYLQSVLPVNSTFRKFVDKTEESVKTLNDAMRELARTTEGVTYVDLYSKFADADGRLDKKYTNDGLHLLGDGYVLWARILNEGGYLK
jgi:lysophospholipase L1-like esterase